MTSKTMYHWWYAYGTFQEGEDNLPHFGDVITHYRLLLGWTRKEAATALNCTTRYIEMLESKKNKNMPESNPRRAAIAKILSIPPVLFGLASPSHEQESTAIPTASGFDTHAISFYEDMLSSSWELYYTSSVQRATKNIDIWIQFLKQDVDNAQGAKFNQLLSVLCRFYQLAALVARERMDIPQALGNEKEAVALAFQGGNAELIASSLLRRTRIYLQTKDYNLALQDAEAAHTYADRSRDPLKGKVYQIIGETYARIAGSDQHLQTKSLKLFDQVGRIVRKGNLEADGSFTKLDITSLYIERAEALTKFGQFDDAHDAIAIAREKLSPELTRWNVNILLGEAETYFAEKEYEDCITIALDALKIVDILQLQGKKERIRRLFRELQQIDANYPLTRLLGKELNML